MTRSTFIASIFLAVSRTDSPLVMELPEEAMLIVSAERRLAASSKEMRVRVEGSEKRRTMVLPRRAETSLNDFAVSKISSISSLESSSSSIRSCLVQLLIISYSKLQDTRNNDQT